MGEVADKAQRAGHDANDSEWLDWAIRAGLVAYGVVHLMVAWLAVQLALGEKSESASNTGALQALAEQPMGSVLIWMIAVGMLLLVVWRLLEFALGYQDETDEKKRWRKRAGSLGQGRDLRRPGLERVQGGHRATARAAGRTPPPPRSCSCPAASSSSASSGWRSSSTEARWSTAGGARSSPSTSTPRASPARTAPRTSLFGKVGYIAKGIAIGIVGGLFCYAAITHDAKKSGGLDQALQTVLEQPFGQVLLIAIGDRHRVLRPVLLRPRPAPVALSGGRTDELSASPATSSSSGSVPAGRSSRPSWPRPVSTPSGWRCTWWAASARSTGAPPAS